MRWKENSAGQGSLQDGNISSGGSLGEGDVLGGWC